MAAAAARGADARGPAVIVYEVERVWSDSIASKDEGPKRILPDRRYLNRATGVTQRTRAQSCCRRPGGTVSLNTKGEPSRGARLSRAARGELFTQRYKAIEGRPPPRRKPRALRACSATDLKNIRNLPPLQPPVNTALTFEEQCRIPGGR